MTTEQTPSTSRQDLAEVANALPFVAQAKSVEDTGLELSLLVDLAAKTFYYSGRPTGRQLAEHLALPYPVAEELIAFLRQEQALEIVGSAGFGEQAYQYALTARGIEKAEDALGRNHYVGAAPVPFGLYVDVLSRQPVSDLHVSKEAYVDGLSDLVLNRGVMGALGPAVNSGRSVLIYGSSGNGKTSIALAIGRMLSGQALIPFAVESEGQIIKVFDPRLHRQITPEVRQERRQNPATSQANEAERRRDLRWAVCSRPVVVVGGELTLKDLELTYSTSSKFYIAPLQWKANGGMLVIDDFGRQMVQPQELLNRWIVPMEQGVDHLSLHSGDTIELPFEILLIFSTNIPPGHLGDEAFFRRIRHKIEITGPNEEEFVEILRRACQDHNVPFTEEGARYLIDVHYKQCGREFKGCHPRDLLELLTDMTSFYGEQPTLTPDWLDLACASYFVETEEEAA
jgi:predicted ATPase with chaperone activity